MRTLATKVDGAVKAVLGPRQATQIHLTAWLLRGSIVWQPTLEPPPRSSCACS